MLIGLIVCGILTLLLAFVGMVGLSVLTADLTRKRPSSDALVKRAATLPIKAVLWFGLIFAGQAIINEVALDRDAGIGDSSRCPLPNGYRLKLSEAATMLEPSDGKAKGVANVTLLQVEGPYYIGLQGDGHVERSPRADVRTGTYFLLDTRSRRNREFESEEQLRTALGSLGLQLDLVKVDRVYWRYRLTLVDAVALAAILALPSYWLVRFVRDVMRVRREETPVTSS